MAQSHPVEQLFARLPEIRPYGGGMVGVTFETTLPLDTVIPAVLRFMSEHFGPLTWVRFNQLPDGPCIGVTYQDLGRALEAGDLSGLVGADRLVASGTSAQEGAR